MLTALNRNKWIQSLLIVCFLFLVINLFLFPLFNSGDDVFLAYTLGGGFGEAPTHLLHYDHIWHPALGWIVKILFTAFPGINWYTVSLIAFQFLGCTTILYVFLHRFQWIVAIVLFVILFFFFEVRILLSLNFTSTAWILACGGFALLLHLFGNGKKEFNFFIAFSLLLLSGLLRLQIFFAVTLLFLPAFLFYARKQYKKWGTAILVACTILFLLNLQHKQFYKKNIPNWQTEENFRQILFYAYNRPVHTDKSVREVFGDSVTRAFYNNYFFYDTNIISSEKAEHIVKSLARHRDLSSKEDQEALYWTFMELRVYILLLSVIFFLLWGQGVLGKVLKRWIITSLLVFSAYCYLFIFLKITEPIFTGALMLLWILLCLAMPADRFQIDIKKRNFVYTPILLILPFIWMGVKIIKKDKDNRQKFQSFKCVVSEIGNDPGKLFITTDDALPLDHFYIWDPPIKYQLSNLIYRDKVMNNCYQSALDRLGIRDVMKAIYENENVFLLGREFPELKVYYKNKYGIDITISSKLTEYNCLTVRKTRL